MQRDIDRLNKLGVAHYVLAGMMLGVALLAGAECARLVKVSSPSLLGAVSAGIYAEMCLLASLLALGLAGLAFSVGWGLRQCRRWGLSFGASIGYVILGALSCSPIWEDAAGFGLFYLAIVNVFLLTLGVYTIIVLSSSRARALHAEVALSVDRAAEQARAGQTDRVEDAGKARA